jgi:dienelactone hydrolase
MLCLSVDKLRAFLKQGMSGHRTICQTERVCAYGQESALQRVSALEPTFRRCLLCWVPLLLAGCQGISTQPAPTAMDAESVAGGVIRQRGHDDSETGCRIDYRVHRRANDPGDVRVVLAHGFLRDQDRMQGFADALAQRGLPTLTLDLCNMRPWDGAHRQNGRDMAQLARRLGARDVIYAGFSAGGLAALMAASIDRDAIGVFAMDVVDRGGLGQQLAAELSIPIAGLVADPSSCNARNNGLAVYAAASDARVWRFSGATHCDFETPTDALCELLCEPLGRSPSEIVSIRRAIAQAALATVEAMAVGRLTRDSPQAPR